MLTSIAVAVATERIAYRPLRRAPRLVPLITAIGASFFLQYSFRGLYGSGVESYPQVSALNGDLLIGDLMLVVAVILVGVIGFFAVRPLYRMLKTRITGPASEMGPLAVSLLLVAIVVYVAVFPLHGIL
ncbi:MAG: hypothetical protein R3264_02160, partial [Anaerolineae bacterium]|nr:hypothetical protein [Anaerolineae bacterium]